MTFLIAFPLQVIVYFTLLHFPVISWLVHCLVVISWALASVIPIVYTPSHSIKDVPLCLSTSWSSPPLVLSHINLRLSSELSSCVFVTLFILTFISCPYRCQSHWLLPLSNNSTLAHCLQDYPIVIHITPAL
jgi:hypothetical protein